MTAINEQNSEIDHVRQSTHTGNFCFIEHGEGNFFYKMHHWCCGRQPRLAPWRPRFNPQVLAHRQFGFMPKMEVHTCYNSQKVTVASV